MTAVPHAEMRLGVLEEDVERAVDRLAGSGFVERLWSRDHTLFGEEPEEISNRLGWLDSPAEMLDRVGETQSFAAAAAGNGFSHALLMGMGGSSLFPEVAAGVFGDGSGALRLHVLDSTDPAAVLRLAETLPLDETLFVAASKSGTTIETRSHLAYFWERMPEGDHWVAITDPGSPLAALARERAFRAVFENRPDIGGRYSALSHFGLVPAALVGTDLEALLDGARRMLDACRRTEPDNPGVVLGAVLAAAVARGRDKLTFRFPPALGSFGAWIEQLLAESTGKAGTGVVPVDGEPRWPVEEYGDDRIFVGAGSELDAAGLAAAGHPVVCIPCDDPYDLGGEIVRWEMATAAVGASLGVNPFDQPDVQAAKDATARVLAEGVPDVPRGSLEAAVAGVAAHDYLAVQAFVDPGGDHAEALRAAAFGLARRLGVAGTFGFGPRYLHSTGQLHKGGPANGVFIQIVGDDPHDVGIPGAGYGFSTLKHAQAAGDVAALAERGRRVTRVRLEDLLDA